MKRKWSDMRLEERKNSPRTNISWLMEEDRGGAAVVQEDIRIQEMA